MKFMRYLFTVWVLASALSMSAIAGTMHTGIAPLPSPTPSAMEGQTEIGLNGTIHTAGGGEATAGEAVVAAALELVQSVLSLL